VLVGRSFLGHRAAAQEGYVVGDPPGEPATAEVDSQWAFLWPIRSDPAAVPVGGSSFLQAQLGEAAGFNAAPLECFQPS
jgi:hypothetical protein